LSVALLVVCAAVADGAKDAMAKKIAARKSVPRRLLNIPFVDTSISNFLQTLS
jgi:hypothetical protein